ncbi:MAG: DUF5615 family PIN-like protein [Ktedonobacteraceae bacterium]|jgi:hypothetical protein
MNIFADENIPQQIVTQLRAEGHQVEYVMQDVLRHRQNELQGAFTTFTEAIIDIRRPPPSFPNTITSE